MVKLGFIVEGHSERILLHSPAFNALLHKHAIDFVPHVFDAKGGGNLLPGNIQGGMEALSRQGATHFVVLTDQEDAPCISSVKLRIDPARNHTIVLAVRAIEAWFLADTAAISQFMKCHFSCDQPESLPRPFDFIKQEMIRLTGRGVNSKRLLCSRMLLSGFSIENAAAHPNCPSARYFLEKLKSLASNG